MSRLGKLPISLPNGTQVKIEKDLIVVRGPKGELKQKLVEPVKIEVTNEELKVSVPHPERKREKALWGLYRSLINNMVKGVNEGFEKKLEIVGVGYRAEMRGDKLILNVGYSHPVEFTIPADIKSQVDGNIINISGIDKQRVGEIAAQIRKVRKPEPYKGKGIKYIDEVIRRKEGKSTAKGE
jgi:large subunit ribosomal protein L6